MKNKNKKEEPCNCSALFGGLFLVIAIGLVLWAMYETGYTDGRRAQNTRARGIVVECHKSHGNSAFDLAVCAIEGI